jgi:hypothetical protein
MRNCNSGVRAPSAEVERRVIAAIEERLSARDLYAEFARTYERECNGLASRAANRDSETLRRLSIVEHKIASIVAAVEQGLFHSSMKERLSTLEAEHSRIAAVAAEPAPAPVSVHPNLAELYRRKVQELETLLADVELGAEAMNLIRSMITGIVVRPKEDGSGVDLELSGDLARILWLCGEDAQKQNAQAVSGAGRVGGSGYVLSVVARGAANYMNSVLLTRKPGIEPLAGVYC